MIGVITIGLHYMNAWHSSFKRIGLCKICITRARSHTRTHTLNADIIVRILLLKSSFAS
jgi:hypothetical protein